MHDGRGNEQEPALLPWIGEDLILAEDLAGEPRKHCAHLQCSSAGSEVAHERRRLAAIDSVEEGTHRDTHSGDIRGNPCGTIDHGRTPVAGNLEPGDATDRFDCLRRQVAQHRDRLACLHPRKFRSLRCQARCGADRQAPID